MAALERLRRRGRRASMRRAVAPYEAGYALEPRPGRAPGQATAGDPPLLWFGLFGRAEDIAPDAVAALYPGAPHRHPPRCDR